MERVSEAKQRDGRRQTLAHLFATWWEKHGDRPVAESELHDDVKQLMDPQDRGRQFRAYFLGKHAGTRMAGFLLTRQESVGEWSAATYALKPTSEELHREHRQHRAHTDEVEPVGRHGLLDVRRGDGDERVEEAPRFVQGPGGVGIQADLVGQREALAHVMEGSKLARKCVVTPGAELDLEGGEALGGAVGGTVGQRLQGIGEEEFAPWIIGPVL